MAAAIQQTQIMAKDRMEYLASGGRPRMRELSAVAPKKKKKKQKHLKSNTQSYPQQVYAQ